MLPGNLSRLVLWFAFWFPHVKYVITKQKRGDHGIIGHGSYTR